MLHFVSLSILATSSALLSELLQRFRVHVCLHQSRGGFTDVEEYLERVVPANRLTEVTGLLKSFQVEDLLAMTDGDTLQLVILVEQKLTFEARFLYRYLRAAARVHCTNHELPFSSKDHALSTVR